MNEEVVLRQLAECDLLVKEQNRVSHDTKQLLEGVFKNSGTLFCNKQLCRAAMSLCTTIISRCPKDQTAVNWCLTAILSVARGGGVKTADPLAMAMTWMGVAESAQNIAHANMLTRCAASPFSDARAAGVAVVDLSARARDEPRHRLLLSQLLDNDLDDAQLDSVAAEVAGSAFLQQEISFVLSRLFSRTGSRRLLSLLRAATSQCRDLDNYEPKFRQAAGLLLAGPSQEGLLSLANLATEQQWSLFIRFPQWENFAWRCMVNSKLEDQIRDVALSFIYFLFDPSKSVQQVFIWLRDRMYLEDWDEHETIPEGYAQRELLLTGASHYHKVAVSSSLSVIE